MDQRKNHTIFFYTNVSSFFNNQVAKNTGAFYNTQSHCDFFILCGNLWHQPIKTCDNKIKIQSMGRITKSSCNRMNQNITTMSAQPLTTEKQSRAMPTIESPSNIRAYRNTLEHRCFYTQRGQLIQLYTSSWLRLCIIEAARKTH